MSAAECICDACGHTFDFGGHLVSAGDSRCPQCWSRDVRFRSVKERLDTERVLRRSMETERNRAEARVRELESEFARLRKLCEALHFRVEPAENGVKKPN